MRKIAITEFISVDGVIEDPGGSEDYAHGAWSFDYSDPEGMKFKLGEVVEFDGLLLGRVTYEGFAAAWPGRTDEAGFAERMNAMPKYVVSESLTSAAWNNSHIVKGDVAAEVRALKETQGGDIMVAGSRQLARFLIEQDLIDEYRLLMHPILLGSGKRLFADDMAETRPLKLTHCQQLATGSLILKYEPARG
jgi:dihydrofolate reductase